MPPSQSIDEREEYRLLSSGPGAFETYARRATLKEALAAREWDGSKLIIEKRTVTTTTTEWERVDV